MTPEQIALAMGAYIRKHGFSPRLYGPNGCGCFLRANELHTLTKEGTIAEDMVKYVIGSSLGTYDLIDNGWTEGRTDDAAAACDIAADLLAP